MSKAFTIASVVILLTVGILFSLALIGQDNQQRSAFFTAALIAADSTEVANLHYVGAKKCRICHLDIYDSWQKSKHAKAMSLLDDEQRADESCVRCHSTGKKADGTLIENVECEACHGPGSEYRKMRVMKNLDKAIQLGLIVNDEAVCVGCHNEASPTFKGFTYVPGDPDGIHIMPSAAKSR